MEQEHRTRSHFIVEQTVQINDADQHGRDQVIVIQIVNCSIALNY